METCPNWSFKLNPQYIAQQEILQRIANELGLVMYKPDYHGKTRDPFTVLFYTKNDALHNLAVDKQLTRYSRSEADDLMRLWHQPISDDCIYRDYVWSFQNTDINGHIDLNYANFGRIRLLAADAEVELKAAMKAALLAHNGGET